MVANNLPPAALLHPLAYAREALGMGKKQFAQAIQDRGATLGYNLGTTRSAVFKWERGDHEPDVVTQIVIGDLLGVPGSVRRSAAWPRWLPAFGDRVFEAPWTRGATLEVLTALSGSEPMDRRGFLAVGGAALVGIGAQWASAESAWAETAEDDAALVAAAKGDAVTPATIMLLRSRIDTLRAMEAEAGGSTFLESARTDLALIRGMIENGRYDETTQNALYSLAAEVCCLRGWMSYDANLHGDAQKHYAAALRAAKSAGDDTIGAHTICFMATQAATNAEQRAAVGLMESAANARSRVPRIMQASLAAHQTTVLVKAGEHRHAALVMNRAFAALERSDDDVPSYLRWFGESQLRSTEGRFLMATGESQKATEALEKSVRHASPRDKAVRCGTLALAYQQAGNLDGALDAADRALGLIEKGIHTERGVERLQDVKKAFSRNRAERRVKETSDRIAALAA